VFRRIGFGLAWGVVGYIAGAVGGGLLVNTLSSNTFDRETEAAMTGAFVIGPLLRIVAAMIGAWRAGPKPGGATALNDTTR
jgi:hypothetical protein